MPIVNTGATSLVTAKPAITVVVGPAKSGKTRWAVQSALATAGSAVLVAPTSREADQLNRVIAAAGGTSSPLVSTTFPLLASEIVRSADSIHSHALNHSLQRLILAGLVREHIGATDYLAKALVAPGFVDVLQRRVLEWKIAGATADLIEAALHDSAIPIPDNALRHKMPGLIRILRAYEQLLSDNRLMDNVDYRRSAVDLLTSNSLLSPFHAQLIVFDGFHQFDEVQFETIRALANKNEHGASKIRVVVTLSHDESRHILFAAPGRTLSRLRSEFIADEIKLTNVRDPNDAIRELGSRLYKPSPTRQTISPAAEKNATAGAKGSQTVEPQILIMSAPNAYMEAEMVARQFLRLRSQPRFTWADFGIVVRNTVDYSETISAVFERFQIPFWADVNVKLTQNPLIACLLNLLKVYRFGWKRPDVIAFLKSSYISSNRMYADSVATAAERLGVREEKQSWIDTASTISAGLKEIEFAFALMARFEPGLCEPRISVGVRAQRLLDLVNTIGLVPGGRLSDADSAASDNAALRTAAAELKNLTMLERICLTGPGNFEEFYESVMECWSRAAYSLPHKPDSVCLVEPGNTREHTFKAAAVMGLTERVFPRPIIEDPFLRDEERASLAAAAGVYFEPIRNQADTERFLFYLAVTSPSHHLILSYPRTGEERDLLPSFFLDETTACAAGLIANEYTTLGDIAPRLQFAAGDREQDIAALACVYDPLDQVLPVANSNDNSRVAATIHIDHALSLTDSNNAIQASIESRNLPDLPKLTASDLCTEFGALNTAISVPQISAYGRCPFHFLMRFRLGVEPDVRDRFNTTKLEIIRKALHKYYATNHKGSNLSPAQIYSDLQGIANEICAGAIPDVLFEKRGLLRVSVLAALQGVALREHNYNTRFETNPSGFDMNFGYENNTYGGLTISDQAQRTNSTSRPLILRDGDYELRISGRIDRIDVDQDGKSLILNFESERSPDYGKLVRGEVVDLPLYMLAAERVFNLTAAVGCTDSLKERGRRRLVRTQHMAPARYAPVEHIDELADVRTVSREQYSELVNTAMRATIRLARRIESAEVPAVPGEYCRTCAYGSICRTSIAQGRE